MGIGGSDKEGACGWGVETVWVLRAKSKGSGFDMCYGPLN